VDEPDLLDRLSALDHGLSESAERPYVAPPPLVDRLLIPEGEGRWRSNCLTGQDASRTIDSPIQEEFDGLDEGLLDSSATADSVFASGARDSGPRPRPRMHHVVIPSGPLTRIRTSGTFPRVLAAQLVLTMMCGAAGAAGAAFVFHDRLAVAMARVEAHLR